MFSYDEKMIQSLFRHAAADNVSAMARCNCTACNSCSCGRCYGDDCVSQCTGCHWLVSDTAGWDSF